MGPNGKPVTKISVSQALMKEMWENESPKIRAEVEEERERRYMAAMEEYERIQFVGSQSPQQFQIAIDHLYTYLKQVSTVVTNHTGFAITIIVGGPLPVANSKLITSHVHKGETAGDNPLDFGSYAHETFNNVLMPKFAEFLAKMFSQDIGDARSLSLPKSATPEALSSAANGKSNLNPTTTAAAATSASATTSVAPEHHNSTVSMHSPSLTPLARGPAMPFAGGRDLAGRNDDCSLDGQGEIDDLGSDVSDHRSKDERVAFNWQPDNRSFSPNTTSPLLLSPTLPLLSTTSTLSGMAVLSSPGTADVLSPILLTPFATSAAAHSGTIAQRPSNNRTQYGAKHKARTLDISTTMSPPCPKKHMTPDKSPTESLPDSPTPPSDNPVQSSLEKQITPSDPLASSHGSLNPTSEISDSGDEVKWYADLLEHMDEIAASKEWSVLLTNWILIEDLLGNSKESTSQLSTEHCPIAIHQWVKWA